MGIDLDTAKSITLAARAAAKEHGLKPIAVVVLDAGGHIVTVEREDGTGSRSLMARAKKQAYFISAAASAIGGSLVPVPGGVLAKDETGTIVGCVGISGDTSDNDELAAVAGIKSVSLVPQPD